MEPITFTVLYFLGFLSSVVALSAFGKKMGFDFDKPKTYVNYDDWSSNKSAFTAFSLVWPIFWSFMSLAGAYLLLEKITNLILKIFNR